MVSQADRIVARSGTRDCRNISIRAMHPSAARRRLPDSLSIRLLDLFVAVPGIVGLAAIYLLFGFPRMETRWRVGKGGAQFREWGWAKCCGLRWQVLSATHLTRVPAMINLFLGEMTLVGPQLDRMPLNADEAEQFRLCRTIAPGFFSLFTLRQRANIDFGNEVDTELEFVRNYSLPTVLGVLTRHILLSFHARHQRVAEKQIRILDIRIDNIRMAEALDWIVNRIQLRLPPAQLSFVNAHCANVARTAPAYKEILDRSALVLADGIGMKLAGTLLKRPLAQNVNGTDMLPRLCRALQDIQGSVYLLGGLRGVAENVALWMSRNYPDLRVVGVQDGFFPETETSQVIDTIRSAKADVLLVAMGVPRQEIFIGQYLEKTGVHVAMGVGGLFDFYSGRISRAPQWLRELGLEWVYRLYQEPRRMWHRYIVGNLLFMYWVMRERSRTLPGKEARS